MRSLGVDPVTGIESFEGPPMAMSPEEQRDMIRRAAAQTPSAKLRAVLLHSLGDG